MKSEMDGEGKILILTLRKGEINTWGIRDQ